MNNWKKSLKRKSLVYWYWGVAVFWWFGLAIVIIPLCWFLAIILSTISYPIHGYFQDTFDAILFEVGVDKTKDVYSTKSIEKINKLILKRAG